MLRNISVGRLTVISAKSFGSVIAKFDTQVGLRPKQPELLALSWMR
jgi:hypothetical protein